MSKRTDGLDRGTCRTYSLEHVRRFDRPGVGAIGDGQRTEPDGVLRRSCPASGQPGDTLRIFFVPTSHCGYVVGSTRIANRVVR